MVEKLELKGQFQGFMSYFLLNFESVQCVKHPSLLRTVFLKYLSFSLVDTSVMCHIWDQCLVLEKVLPEYLSDKFSDPARQCCCHSPSLSTVLVSDNGGYLAFPGLPHKGAPCTLFFSWNASPSLVSTFLRLQAERWTSSAEEEGEN